MRDKSGDGRKRIDGPGLSSVAQRSTRTTAKESCTPLLGQKRAAAVAEILGSVLGLGILACRLLRQAEADGYRRESAPMPKAV